MSRQHAKFLARLLGSNPGRFAFAYWLNDRHGYTVELPPIKGAPTAAEHRLYADKGDVFAWKAGPRLRIEVKTLNVTFSCRADWPFREVFVSSVATVFRAFEETYAWVNVSQDLRAAVIVEGSTWESWYVVTKLVSNTGNVESNFAAPLDKVTFISLDCD